MEYRYLLVQRDARICRLTLNRSERLNALNVRIGVELLDALEDCDHDADVCAVVLTGAGRAFCAGDDLRVCRNRESGIADSPIPSSKQNHPCKVCGPSRRPRADLKRIPTTGGISGSSTHRDRWDERLR